jgi:hypothetical protein
VPARFPLYLSLAEARQRQREHGSTAPGRRNNTPATNGTSVRARDQLAKIFDVGHSKINQAKMVREARYGSGPSRNRRGPEQPQKKHCAEPAQQSRSRARSISRPRRSHALLSNHARICRSMARSIQPPPAARALPSSDSLNGPIEQIVLLQFSVRKPDDVF